MLAWRSITFVNGPNASVCMVQTACVKDHVQAVLLSSHQRLPSMSSSLPQIRPDHMGSSLSQWDCPELARRLKADGVVPNISADTVRRILRSHKLKPWRHHLWLEAFV